MFVLVTTGPVSEVVTRGDWIDRTTYPWTEGPWDDEPDKVVWVDSFTDLDCMIVRNHHGAWCGYVGVPPGHRWHGQRYQDIDYDLAPDLDVHGGLTFADRCMTDGPVCHTPPAGRPDDIWWLGFDCHHYLDRAPGTEAVERGVFGRHPFAEQWERFGDEYAGMQPTYKPMSYVLAEVVRLAVQVAPETP